MTTPAEEIVNSSRRGMEQVRFLQGNSSVHVRSKLADMMVFYRNLNSIARKAALLERELGFGIQAAPESEPEESDDELRIPIRTRRHYLASNLGENIGSETRITVEPPTTFESTPHTIVLNLTRLFGNHS